MKQSTRKFFAAALAFSMLFNSNTTILANTNEGDEPEVTEQPELPENVNEEGTPVEGQSQEAPETTPDETVVPQETEQEDPAAQTPAAEGTEPTSEPTATPEAALEEAEAEGTDPENEKEEEETASWNFVGVFYCADDGTRFEEALPVTAETKPVSDYAKEFEGYTWTGSASINQNPISALSNNSYTISNEWDETEVSCSDYFSLDEVIYVEFSYELAQEQIEYETHFEYEDNRVKVTADTVENAGFEKGTTLHADYMEPGSPAYEEAVAAFDQMNDGYSHLQSEYVLYDVYFTTKDGARVEPDANVFVTMDFKENITMSDNVDLQHADVVHYSDNGNAEVVGDVTLEGLEVTNAWFNSEEFSPFGVRMLGEGVQQTSSNLQDFVKSARIIDASGATVTTVKEGAPITIDVQFEEDQDGIQFINTGDEMSWNPLPENFTPSNDNGVLEIHGTDKDGEFTVYGNRYVFSSDGSVKFYWNTDDRNFSRLAAGLNAKFTLGVTGSFNGNSTIKDKNGSTLINVTVDKNRKATVHKDGAYWSSDNKIHYTVKVTSDGMTNNVSVKDVISGTALTFDNNVTAVSTTGKEVILNPGSESVENGFSYVIPSMTDKEVITLTYTASVDTSKLTGKGTPEQTGNSITVEPDNGQGQTSTKDFNNSIGWTSVNKSAGTVTDKEEETGKKVIPYTIVVNKEMAASVGGSHITDEIAQDSQTILSYAGTGITVVVKDKDNNTVRTDTVPWESIKGQNAKTWTYTIPTEDKGKIYRYEISYVAEADISGLATETTLKNKVTDTTGNESEVSVTVGPKAGDAMEIAKTATNVSWEKTSWKVTITVPKNGLDKAIVTDNYPTQTYNNEKLVDILDADTKVDVTGLLDGESYESNTTDSSKMVLTFYKMVDGEKKEGLIGNRTSKRTIEITFTTINNEKWLEYANEAAWLKEHKNIALLSNGSQQVEASAEVTPIKSSFEKKFDGISKTTLADGTVVPMLKYEILFTGLNKPNVTITDTFDGNYFEYYLPNSSESWEADYLRGGNQYSQDKMGSSRVNAAASTGQIIFTLTDSSIPKDGDAYYSHYKLVYYVRVKSAEALNKLNNIAYQSESGSVPITNTATSELGSDDVTGNYTVDTVSKQIINNNALNEQGLDPSKVKPQFKIVANPSAADIDPESDTITLTDSYSGLSVEYDTIVADPSEGVTWNASGNTLTFTIPDRTRVEITYTARIVGNGNTDIKNHINLNGQEKNTDRQVNVRSNGEGTVSIPSIKILKHEYGDMTEKLSGAKFELYDAGGETPVKVVRKETGTPVTFTTENGIATITPDSGPDGWDLKWNHKYLLKEIEAPTGYAKINYDPEFTITEGDVADYNKYIFLNNDIIRVADKKIEVKKALEVNKAIIGVAPRETYNFQLTPISATDGTNPISPIPVPEELTTSVSGAGKAAFGDIEFNKAGTYVYQISEIIPEDATDSLNYSTDTIVATVNVTLTDVGTAEAAVSYKRISGEAEIENDNTITNIYEGSLRIQKSVTVDNKETTGTLADGDYTFNVINSNNVVVATKTLTITNGVSSTEEVQNLAEGTYIVREIVSALKPGMTLTSGNDLVIEVKGGKTGDAAPLASFTNNLKTGGLKITKEVRINNGRTSDTLADGDYLFDVKDAAGNIVTTATVKINGGKANTAIVDGLQAGNYTITERVNDNPSNMALLGENNLTAVVKAGVSGSDTEAPSVTFTNNKEATGSLEIKKNVTQNGNPITNNVADGTYQFIIKNKNGEVVESNATITINGGVSNVYTREKLPIGPYTVTEVTNNLKPGMVISTGADGVAVNVTENGTAIAEFTNNIDTGSLKVNKSVTGNAGDKSADFDFVIHLEYNGEPLGGTYPTTITALSAQTSGTLKFGTDGNSDHFKLKDQESLEVLDLPKDVKWYVSETPVEGYDTEYSAQNGTIGSGVSVSSVTNNRDSEGTLVLHKKLSGNAALTTDTFNVSVVFTGDDLNDISYTTSITHTDTTNQENKTRTIILTIKGNDTVTFEHIPNGVSYAINETTSDEYEPSYKIVYLDPVNGEEKAVENRTDGAESKFDINSSDIKEQSTLHSVELTNTKNTYGDLRLTKSLSGNDIDPNQLFHFNISLSGQNVDSSYVAETTTPTGTVSTTTLTGTNGMFSVSFKAGEEVTIKNIANGTHYEITEEEANKDGFVTTAVGDSGTINTSSSTTSTVQTAAFTNTRNSDGSLVISKKLRGNTIEPDQSFSVTVTLTSANNQPVVGTFSGYEFNNVGKHEFTIKGNETIRINGIPNGVNFVVAETGTSGYESPKYVVNDGTETESAQGTIRGSGEQRVQTIKIINEKNTTGDLKISKVVQGNSQSSDSFEFTINVEGAGNESYNVEGIDGKTKIDFVNDTATLTLTGGQSATIIGLPNNAPYTVTEKSYVSSGYTTTSENTTGIINHSAVQEAKFINTKNVYGDLVIQKAIEGNTPADSSDTFKFVVVINKPNDYSPSGTEKYELYRNGTKVEDKEISFDSNNKLTIGIENVKAADSISVRHLPAGATYTLTETLTDEQRNKGYQTPLFSVDGKERSESCSGTIKPATESEAAVEHVDVVNTRNQYGNLMVKKSVTGNSGDKTKEFDFTVKVDGAGNTEYDFEKSITGSTDQPTGGKIKFTEDLAIFKLKHNETITIKNLPNNASYTVAEADYSADGYETSFTGNTGTINSTSSVVASFTNKRDTVGKLILTKKISGNAASTTDDFEFEVELKKTDDTVLGGTYTTKKFIGSETPIVNTIDFNKTPGKASLKIKADETIAIEGLPTGTKYIVTESMTGLTGYDHPKYNGVVIENAAGTISDKTDSVVEVTNTKNLYGGFQLSKTTAGNDGDKKKWFAFRIKLTGSDGKPVPDGQYGDLCFKNGVVDTTQAGMNPYKGSHVSTEITDYDNSYPIIIAKGDIVKVYGLPNGTIYEITEEPTALTRNSYISTVTTGSDNGEIIGNVTKDKIDTESEYSLDSHQVVFTNTRNFYGKLQILKKLEGNATDASKDFNVKITLKDANNNPISGSTTYHLSKIDGAPINFVNGVATITLKGGKSKTIYGIPKGYHFTVEEVKDEDARKYQTKYLVEAADIKDATPTTDHATGTIEEKMRKVTVTNRRDTGALKITKSVTVNGKAVTASNQTRADGTYTFEVLKKDSSEVIATKTISITNGIASSINVADLEAGTYIVREKIEDNSLMQITEGANGIEVVVEAGEEATVPEVKFTNNRDLGSLKITKIVTVNGGTGDEADGTYMFKVEGPDSFTKTVPLTIENGKSNTVTVDNLIAGEYTVSEIEDGSPENIKLISEKNVSVTVKTGSTAIVPTAKFTNNAVSIKFNKYDSNGNVTLSGATFELKDKNGVLLDTWVTNGSVYDISDKVVRGEKYTLTETKAPEGFKKLDNPITIEIDEKGVVKVDGKAMTSSDVVKLLNAKLEDSTTPTPSYTSVDVSAKKVWVDGDNANGKRPSKVRVHLLANGVDTGYVAELSEANNWFYTWYALPLNNEDGNFVTYDVVEEGVDGYTSSVSGDMYGGYTITNTNKKKSPKTDDTFHVFGWAVSLIASMIASMIAALLLRRKK